MQKDSLENKLAIGANHFFASRHLPGVGIGNRIALGDYGFDNAMEMVAEYIHGIECLNVGCPPMELAKFESQSVRRRFEELVHEHVGERARLTPISLNLAVAAYFSERYGKWQYAGHDTHVYYDIKFNGYMHKINRIGRAYNAIDFEWRKGKPTPEDVIRLLLSPQAKDRVVPFLPVHTNTLGFVDINSKRKTDTSLDRIYTAMKKISIYASMFPAMWRDFWESAMSVKR